MTCAFNIFICLIGGIFIDWVGLKISLLLFAGMSLLGKIFLLGQVLVVGSTIFLPHWWFYLFLFGRILLGSGI